ncbi:MAG: glycosyltransferase family 2 protein, partial [Burkholderiales bacterium]
MIRALRLFRYARALAATTRTHLREHGWAATADRAVGWIGRRLPGGGSRAVPVSDPPRYEWAPLPARVVQASAGAHGRLLCLGVAPESLALAQVLVANSPDAALVLLRRELPAVLLVVDQAWTDGLKRLLAACAELHVPTVSLCDATAIEPIAFAPPSEARMATLSDPNAVRALRRRTLLACDFVLATQESAVRSARADRKATLPWSSDDTAEALAARATEAYRRRHRPRVSIVTILYNKSRELPYVLATYAAQSYQGEIEIVFVDDRSPDNSVAVVEAFATDLAAGRVPGRALDIQVVANDKNSGNCVSRNVGIAAATGDVLIIIDADCMLTRRFVERHVAAHAFDDCEVVIGPLNIETREVEPLDVLAMYAADPARAAAVAGLQDPTNVTSFLNCITRNFSIKRAALEESDLQPLFDPLFGYSADPNSGFGWEDIEMGYRLYRSGARVKYVREEFSVHVSAPEGAGRDRPERSLRNLVRLFDKHPELAWVAPEWANRTQTQLVAWAQRLRVELGAEAPRLESQLAPARQGPMVQTTPRRLRVLSYRWHVPHQYELWKLPIDVTLVTGLGMPMTETWEYEQRPLPPNARFAHIDTINPRDYDVAILHFDENVLTPENCNGMLGADWGAAFKFLREKVDLPKIAICHGTPQFRG